jgi:hypothetical protein
VLTHAVNLRIGKRIDERCPHRKRDVGTLSKVCRVVVVGGCVASGTDKTATQRIATSARFIKTETRAESGTRRHRRDHCNKTDFRNFHVEFPFVVKTV